MYVCMYVCKNACMHGCIYVFMYACMHVYVCTAGAIEKGVLKHVNKSKQTSKITGITEYYMIINTDKNDKTFMAFLVKGKIKSKIK